MTLYDPPRISNLRYVLYVKFYMTHTMCITRYSAVIIQNLRQVE